MLLLIWSDDHFPPRTELCFHFFCENDGWYFISELQDYERMFDAQFEDDPAIFCCNQQEINTCRTWTWSRFIIVTFSRATFIVKIPCSPLVHNRTLYIPIQFKKVDEYIFAFRVAAYHNSYHFSRPYFDPVSLQYFNWSVQVLRWNLCV